MRLQFEKLTRQHDRKRFSCLDEEVDIFLKQKAMQDQELDLSRTYVLTDHEVDPAFMIGYYTITPIRVSQEIILGDRPRIKREIPTVLLGQLGVDHRHQGKRFGIMLLLHSQFVVLQTSDMVGFRAMVLDARNEALAEWYGRNGFLRVENNLRMTKRVDVIRRELSFS